MLLLNAMLLASAASSCLLGGIVLYRNRRKITHRLFAVLASNLCLWALGVLVISNCETESAARFWIQATFIVAAFLPVTYYQFILYFPNQRLEGIRWMCVCLYGGALFEVLGSFTPYYIKSVSVIAGQPPVVQYRTLFYTYSMWICLSIIFSFSNLIGKLRRATGVERRQIEHVLLAIVLTTTLSTATNVLAPALRIQASESFGPVFIMVLIALLAYAMVRYHLLDIWVLISRTTVYAMVLGAVVAVFFLTVSVVRLLTARGAEHNDFLATLFAALVITLVLQPLKERIQVVVQRTLLKRHYDVNRLCAQITKKAARVMRLDDLLPAIAGDIRQAMGVNLVRIWLVDPANEDVLACAYSTNLEDMGRTSGRQQEMLDLLREDPDPVVLRKLLHQRPTQERIHMAQHLAELDAYLCVPLMAGARMVGLLTLDEKKSGDIYGADDISVFSTVAGPLATAIDNARLYARLDELNLHMTRILTSMRGGVIAVDKQGKITTFNASADSLFGPLEIGQDMRALRPELAQILESTLRRERGIGDIEIGVARESGDVVPVSISSSCLQIPNGGMCGAMAMIHDLTQVKRLEQNVLRADRLSSIGTLAAGMAHEIKNPLVSIKTFTQLLVSKFDDHDFRKTYSEIVPHEVDRIDHIVSRLLDFARPKPVLFQPHDMVLIIEQVLALVENQLRKNNIAIVFERPAELALVHGDEQQLHQLFLNLFLNAVDAMKSKRRGTLTIQIVYDRTHLRGKGFSPFVETECMRILVADTGCGIERDHLKRLFTPFFTTKPEGCGLGLSVVHGIVTEHGGEIDIDSAVGVGTTFAVTFPVKKEALAATEA